MFIFFLLEALKFSMFHAQPGDTNQKNQCVSTLMLVCVYLLSKLAPLSVRFQLCRCNNAGLSVSSQITQTLFWKHGDTVLFFFFSWLPPALFIAEGESLREFRFDGCSPVSDKTHGDSLNKGAFKERIHLIYDTLFYKNARITVTAGYSFITNRKNKQKVIQESNKTRLALNPTTQKLPPQLEVENQTCTH